MKKDIKTLYLIYGSIIAVFLISFFIFIKSDISEAKLKSASSYAENNQGEITGYAVLGLLAIFSLMTVAVVVFKKNTLNIKFNSWEMFCTFSGIFMILQILIRSLNYILNKFGYGEIGSIGYSIISVLFIISFLIYFSRVNKNATKDL